MKVAGSFGGSWLTEVEAAIKYAEDAGYDFAGTPETSHDSMLAAAIALNATSRIEVQTGVTIASLVPLWCLRWKLGTYNI